MGVFKYFMVFMFCGIPVINIELNNAKADESPYSSLVPTITSTMPDEVEGYKSFPDKTMERPYMDHFSWQSFIALAWPADTKESAPRGLPVSPDTPATFLAVNKGGVSTIPTIFESWRDVTQLFLKEGEPVAWNSNEKAYSPCTSIKGNAPTARFLNDSVIVDTNQAGKPYPLIDQNLNYARYEMKFNEKEYTEVRDNKWYIKQEKQVKLGAGSIEVKTSWRKMTKDDDLSRYYVIDAVVLGLETEELDNYQQGACEVQKMGLTGMHIMHKTEKFHQWVWSTFEQVDNLTPGHGAPPGLKPSYSNGHPTEDTKKYGFNYKPRKIPAALPPIVPPISDRKPVNVYRVKDIPNTPGTTTANFAHGVSTQGMNKTYQELLKGTVWEYYELVGTQWPSLPEETAKFGVPFPAYLANTVIETYFQNTSCMGCHSSAYSTSDFSWSIKLRARDAKE